jgi:hypothetical protein
LYDILVILAHIENSFGITEIATDRPPEPAAKDVKIFSAQGAHRLKYLEGQVRGGRVGPMANRRRGMCRKSGMARVNHARKESAAMQSQQVRRSH